MKSDKLFKDYLKEIHSIARKGDAREESFYSALKDLLERFATATNHTDVNITILPRPTDAGNPDFRVWNGQDQIIGYIEAKAPYVENLDSVETSEQLRRYRATFPNLILTNFLEFRLYRNGQRVNSVLLARPVILNQLGAIPPAEKPAELTALLNRFLDFSLPKTFTAESLAVELAKRTRFLRYIVARELAEEKSTPGPLTGFYEAFQKFLIGHLTPEEFTDLYAQTITYGLFAARVRSDGVFNRRTAFDCIPRTIGILRDLFSFISLGYISSLGNLPTELEWIVDEIAQVLAVADVPGILDEYYRKHRGSDPIVHFYETFLAKYDPEERRQRGVYYTPEPVVSYIVHSLHKILKEKFGKPDGLADKGVTLLDPAAGTMTFVAKAAQQAVKEFVEKYGTAGRISFIRDHILKNFYAFELKMAPYAIGHLKMGFFLEELGYRLADDERGKFYLTNTLEMEELEQTQFPILSSLAEESRLAGEVKRETPILVILGNPPYFGHSANRSKWILEQIKEYKKIDGKPLGERNPKWLNDDYVKFLRFAQWKIEQAGLGVVGMITNHGYLDNPTFRGMRQSLMRTFDEIYVLDLHGNAEKHERVPEEVQQTEGIDKRDENIFDITLGVAIAFFIKYGDNRAMSVSGQKEQATIHHADLWGRRERKYRWLETHDVFNTPWQKVHPTSPFYLFVPQDESLSNIYNTFIPIPEIFPIHSVGIVTARDRLTICWTPDEIWHTVTVFSRMDPELARQGYKLGDRVSTERIKKAQKDILDSGPNRKCIVPILYRPFDVRYTY